MGHFPLNYPAPASLGLEDDPVNFKTLAEDELEELLPSQPTLHVIPPEKAVLGAPPSKSVVAQFGVLHQALLSNPEESVVCLFSCSSFAFGFWTVATCRRSFCCGSSDAERSKMFLRSLTSRQSLAQETGVHRFFRTGS